MALLAFKPEAGDFDTAEAEGDEDDPDEEVLDVADTVGDDAGVVTEPDGVAAGVQDDADESELDAGFVGDGDTDVVDAAGTC